MRFMLYLLFLGAALALAACAKTPDPDAEVPAPAPEAAAAPAPVLTYSPEPLGKIPGFGVDESAAIAVVDDGVVAFFPGLDGRLHFRRGEHLLLLDEGDVVRSSGGKHLGLFSRPEGLFAFWWQKQVDGAKHFYVRRSTDGGESFEPAIKVNTSFGMLPVYDLATDGAGRLVVVYFDEREPTYRIHANVSHDGGATWLSDDIRLDAAGDSGPFAIEPQVAFFGERVVATWKERVGGDRTRVMTRFSDDGGLEWSSPQELGRFETFFTGDVLAVSPKGLALVGYEPAVGLFGFVSRDGAAWERVDALAGTEEVLAISQTQAVLVNDYELVLVYTLELPGQVSRNRRLGPRVYSARLDLRQGRWLGDGVRIDTGKAHELTSASNPQLVRSGELLLVAWDDSRDILGNVYLAWSSDSGSSWSAPRPLGPPGMKLIEGPLLAAGDDALWVLHDIYAREDRRSQRTLASIRLGLADDGSLTGIPVYERPSPEAFAERLQERAKTFWQLRIDGNHAEAFSFFDPAMRMLFDRDEFAVRQRAVRYGSHELVAFDIHDNIAGVMSRVVFSVPPTQVSGVEFEMEPREETLVMEWVWVEDDWYVVWEGTGRSRFLRY